MAGTPHGHPCRVRVLLTGATGNVGSAVLSRLSEADAVDVEVVGLCRRPPDAAARQTAPYDRVARWMRADVASDDLQDAVRGVDAVVHTAWLLQPAHDPALLRSVNVAGSRRVVQAAVAAGVRSMVVLSSVAAYSPGPRPGAAGASGPGRRAAGEQLVEEDWPTAGVESSLYSRQKAEVERVLDAAQRETPDLRITRVRPGLVLSAHAASSQVRYFLGPLVPPTLLRPGLLPVLPFPAEMALQVVHAPDLADAMVRALRAGLDGGLNVAADPPLDGPTAAATLATRHVDAPLPALRTLVDLTWRARLQPTDAGWIDLATSLPLLSTRRAREELGWTPRTSAPDALQIALDAARDREGGPTAVLRPLAHLPRRLLDTALRR